MCLLFSFPFSQTQLGRKESAIRFLQSKGVDIDSDIFKTSLDAFDSSISSMDEGELLNLAKLVIFLDSQQKSKPKLLGTEITTGSQFEETRDLETKDIAKLIRADIKAAIKSGAFPKDMMRVSVRTELYSMGSAIHIGLKKVPSSWNLLNKAFFKCFKENPYGSMVDFPEHAQKRYSSEVTGILKALENIGNTYNRNEIDLEPTDYSNVRFHLHVGVDENILEKERGELTRLYDKGEL